MTIILPLEPRTEARLIALAQEKGVSANELVRDAIDKILAETPQAKIQKEPTRSLRGLLAKYGSAPSAEEIDQSVCFCSVFSVPSVANSIPVAFDGRVHRRLQHLPREQATLLAVRG